MRSHRILLVTREYGKILSGLGTYTVSLARGLRIKEFKVTVVCPENQMPAKEDGTYLPVKRSGSPIWKDFARAVYPIYRDYDIIHFAEAREARQFVDFRNRVKPPCIIGTVHDVGSAMAKINPLPYMRDYPYDWAKRFLYFNMNRRTEGYTLKRLDRVIAVCEYTVKKIVENYGLRYDKVDTVHNGIDLAEYGQCVPHFSEKDTPCQAPVLLFIGGNFQRKGLRTVIRAVSIISRAYPSVKCLIAGSGLFENRFKSEMQELGVSANFEFLGHVQRTDMEKYFAASHLFVMPSLYESSPFSFMEAMACGLPVIGSNTGGMPELVQHGQDGFLVEPHDPTSLAECVLKVLEDKNLWQRMSQNCRETVKRFTLDNMIEETIKVYEKSLAQT